MTTTPDTSAEIVCPAWLDIDAIVPAKARDDATRLAKAVLDYSIGLNNLVAQASSTLAQIERHCKVAEKLVSENTGIDPDHQEGIYYWLFELAGGKRLYDCVLTIQHVAAKIEAYPYAQEASTE